jgi:glycerol-3-phosphate acyltransferase PlsX
MPIVLDGMGSDNYPDPEIQAAITAASELGEEIILVGNQAVLEPKLKAATKETLPIHIVHAPDMVDMGDKAVESARKKPENSMAIGMNLVKNGEAQAFVTAGNTGAAYFHAVTILRRMQGISRPALATSIPTYKGRCIFLDIGANADCRPEFLVDFALLGSVYAKSILNISNPRVAILSNGEESGKGNQLVKEAFPLMQNSGLNFIGNVESKEIYGGETVDVVVADGFTGNVFIKTSEAVGKLITSVLKEEISLSFSRKMGYLLAKPAFTKLKQLMDPAEIGAAMLLGVNGYVFIGHGRSDSRALVSAIKLASRSIKADLLKAIQSEVQSRPTIIVK